MNEELPGGNEFWDELRKKFPQSITRGRPTYELALYDPGTRDGYRMVFHTEVTVFDFANLLREFFGVEVDLTYNENNDETLTIDHSPIENLLRRLQGEDEE